MIDPISLQCTNPAFFSSIFMFTGESHKKQQMHVILVQSSKYETHVCSFNKLKTIGFTIDIVDELYTYQKKYVHFKFWYFNLQTYRN